jgi:8-amino-7-oxononanoate synthase
VKQSLDTLQGKASDSFLQEKLKERQQKGLMRTLAIVDSGKIDFSSNDYLGFSRAFKLNCTSLNINNSGSTGSRLISGNCSFAESTESLIAEYHQAEAALVFNSGYCANLGLFSCVAGKGDSYIYDEYIHASIIDGMRLSLADRFKFKHNNINDLDEKLGRAKGRKFVAIESVYSMDGDTATLQEIMKICNKHQAHLIVDEAHATGIIGERGEGLVCKLGLSKEVFACVYTFGKALGSHGAAVTGTQLLKDYLINFARSFIYTTALPPHTYLQLQQTYKQLPDAERLKLFELIEYFRKSAVNYSGFSIINSSSAIQAVLIGDVTKTLELSSYLLERGFFAKAVLSPTVPSGTERIRICLHSYNTKEEIDNLLNEINTFLK